MALKQPRVPEYRENEGVAKHLRALTLFLKDFCQDVWTASRNEGRALDSLKEAGNTYVKKSGDNMSGTLSVPLLYLQGIAGSTYRYINVYKHGVSNSVGRIMFNLSDTSRRFYFIQRNADQDSAANANAEYYYLPSPDAGLDKDKTYYILTSKSPATVAQGGTGATSASAARTNLGVATKAETLLAAYPVGAIYISVSSTSPASLFGGTWERMKDRFLLGAGDTYSAGSTGGAATVTLTVDQMPEHRHVLRKQSSSPTTEFSAYAATSDDNTDPSSSASDGVRRYTTYEGGGEAHSNMPPYLTVYMWKRVS